MSDDTQREIEAEQQAADDLRTALTETQAFAAYLEKQVAELRAALRQRAGLLGEVDLSGDAAYASADDLMRLDDLHEIDVIVKRWQASGKRLKLRIRALDIDQQEQIDIESTIKHDKTGEWVRSEALYMAASLREMCIVPKLSDGQAQMMRKHNPTIIRELVRFGWTLSALDDDLIERLVNIDDPTPPATTELSPPGE